MMIFFLFCVEFVLHLVVLTSVLFHSNTTRRRSLCVIKDFWKLYLSFMNCILPSVMYCWTCYALSSVLLSWTIEVEVLINRWRARADLSKWGCKFCLASSAECNCPQPIEREAVNRREWALTVAFVCTSVFVHMLKYIILVCHNSVSL
jgi:hypothetical protein